MSIRLTQKKTGYCSRTVPKLFQPGQSDSTVLLIAVSHRSGQNKKAGPPGGGEPAFCFAACGKKNIILGKCKWQDRPVSRSVLRQLVEKTSEIVPKQGQWRVYYLGFARDGWTEAAQTYANEILAL